tara:strand:- start:91579 stop:91905 length:327 start_codon:yes stop_codon:yes gene_type:complete
MCFFSDLGSVSSEATTWTGYLGEEDDQGSDLFSGQGRYCGELSAVQAWHLQAHYKEEEEEDLLMINGRDVCQVTYDLTQPLPKNGKPVIISLIGYREDLKGIGIEKII